MAKNYASLFSGGNDSIALEQKIFIKEETTRGTLIAPTDSDFIYHIAGGSVNFSQPIISSPHKSGRHHTSIIKEKTETSWTLPTFFNIDTTLGAAAATEIDLGVRVLHKSMFGKEDVTGGSPVYTTEDPPSITFSIFENGDVWAKQTPGSFCESANMTFPGDGQSQVEWGGMAKTSLTVGISELTTIDHGGGNDVIVQAGHGNRFPVGALVMLIEADGTTRSADTPNGAPRAVTAVATDTITVDGAVLADADATGASIYLTYYEPEAPAAINDPQTGLEGSLTIAAITSVGCVRSIGVSATNNHELQDACFGEEGLGGPLFVPGGRFTAEVTVELNMNAELAGFLNDKKNFTGDDLDIFLGDVTGRHLQLELPSVIFAVPEINVPESGTIPISFVGNAYQTSLDQADELTVSYL
jgi:hypothetical protein